MVKNNEGFTLIEMLAVMMIIGILVAIVSISYQHTKIQSRNSQRKTDLATIQSALEMFRSNNGYGSYPSTSSINIGCGQTGGISENGLVYLSNIPKDPLCSQRTYYYIASPDGCDGGPNLVCKNYTIAAALENTQGQCLINMCGSGVDCNYCLDSYGESNP